MSKNSQLRAAPGFTLVELILVMALLAIAAALSVPMLSRSMRERGLKDETTRFIALTEYSRNEAISQGVPMTVWIDPTGGRYGTSPKTGYEGAIDRDRDYTLNADVHFEPIQIAAKNGVIEVIEFAPDGAPSATSIDLVQLSDRFGATLSVGRTTDGWAWEVIKEAK